jgi:hypothetical protein
MLLSIAALLFFPFVRIRRRLRLLLFQLQGTIWLAASDEVAAVVRARALFLNKLTEL